MQVRSLGREDPLEDSMATHSSMLAWRMSWTEEPGGLPSIGITQSWTSLKRLSTGLAQAVPTSSHVRIIPGEDSHGWGGWGWDTEHLPKRLLVLLPRVHTPWGSHGYGQEEEPAALGLSHRNPRASLGQPLPPAHST